MSEVRSASGGLRQAMAWLHTWCGLWFSWMLFAVFLTGTLAVFEAPITHWMTHEPPAQDASHEADTPLSAGLAQRLAWASAYMAQHHPDKDVWELWPADAHGGGELKVYWFDARGRYADVHLDPATGAPERHEEEEVHGRATRGGHHFVSFHYTLLAGTPGMWIVAIATVAMLVALISGVIIHKRIFKDFFTFRPGKGQRSWLDAHNASAVLSLPFQFMIAFTGLVFFATTYLPAGVMAHFGTGKAALRQYAAALQDADKPARTGKPLAVPELSQFALRAQALMGQPVRALVIDHPGDASMRISAYGWNDEAGLQRRITATTGMASFSAATGEVLRVQQPGGGSGGGVLLLDRAMRSLHMAEFGGLAIDWLYFLCGLAGAAMMGTGAILFLAKRRMKHGNEFGGVTLKIYDLIERLNIAAIAGLAIACVAFLWGNLLIPAALEGRAAWEPCLFFAVWALAMLHACWRPPARAWAEQLWLLVLLCLGLPLANLFATGDQLVAQIGRGDWESAGLELTVIGFGLIGAPTAWFLSVKAGRAGSGKRGEGMVAAKEAA